MSEDLKALVRRETLRNAILHDGKAQVNSVMSALMAERLDLRPRARELAKLVAEAVSVVNSMTLQQQVEALRTEFGEEPPRREVKEAPKQKRLPPLPNAVEGAVVTRLAPNPDFVIHIGNARPAILSYEYAKMYRGKFILRFEDTDPRTKTPMREAYDMIKEDLRWLGIRWDEEYIQSQRMEIFYNMMRDALAKGCAYVDIGGDETKSLIAKGQEPPYRSKDPSWQLEQFDRMLSNNYKEGEAVVRFKTDLEHPNPSVRDWVAMRIIDTSRHPHPLTGDKYVVWPTYNFAVSVDDHLMGITHVLRGKEHQVNTEKQKYVYKCFGWSTPTFIHFGRLKLEGFIMSKSYIKNIMSERPGDFMGLDDPRFGTIAGLRRRGILPESIWDVIIDVGIRPGDARLSWTNLAAANRKRLDPTADRIMFVETSQGMSVRLRVEQPGCLEARIPYHPNTPERARSIRVCHGDEIYVPSGDAQGRVRLIGLGNYEVDKVSGVLRYLGGGVDEAREQGLKLIQWVPAARSVNVTVLEPKGLELIHHEGVAEEAMTNYSKGSRLQFMRYGFVIVDDVAIADGKEKYTLIFTHT